MLFKLVNQRGLICMKEYIKQDHKRLIFPSDSFTANLSPLRPPSQHHGQQRYTQFSSATISSASLLLLPAHTSVCVLEQGQFPVRSPNFS